MVPLKPKTDIKILALSICCLGLLSCKPDVQDGELKLVVGPSTANALPIAINSCKQGATDTASIQAPSYEFTTFKYTWAGANQFRMNYIQITLRSGFLQGGIDKSCIIAAEDLIATLGSAAKAIIDPGDTVQRSSSCAVRCGGLKIADGVNSAYVTGTLKVVGVQTDVEGNSTQVVGEADVAVQYEAP
jgi:hypothetical protein